MKFELDESDLNAFDKTERAVIKGLLERVNSNKQFDYVRDSSSFNNVVNLPMNVRTGVIYKGDAAAKLKAALNEAYSDRNSDRDNLQALWATESDLKKIEEKHGYPVGDYKSLKTISIIVEHDGKRETLHNISTLDLPEKYIPNSTTNRSNQIDPKITELLEAYKKKHDIKEDVFNAKYRSVWYTEATKTLSSPPVENFKSGQHHAFETLKALDFDAKNDLQRNLSAAFTAERLGINQNQTKERIALSVRESLEKLEPVVSNKTSLKETFLDVAKKAYEQTKKHLNVYDEYQQKTKNSTEEIGDSNVKAFEANALKTRQALDASEQMKAEEAYTKVSHDPALNLKIANDTNAAITKEFESRQPAKTFESSSQSDKPVPASTQVKVDDSPKPAVPGSDKQKLTPSM